MFRVVYWERPRLSTPYSVFPTTSESLLNIKYIKMINCTVKYSSILEKIELSEIIKNMLN